MDTNLNSSTPRDIVIVDFSHLNMRNLFIAVLQAQPKKKNGVFITEQYIQHHKSLLFNSLQYIKNKFGNSEIILATDGRENWRKIYYPEYKANRKKEESDIDFKEFFEETEKIMNAIRTNFPFRVLHVPEAEADDIAGTLGIHYNKVSHVSLVTSDHDWLQLQAHGNITMYDPMKKENRFLSEYEKEKIDTEFGLISRFTLMHALTGDAGDNVPKTNSMTEFSPNFIKYLQSKDIKETRVKIVRALPEFKELIEKYSVMQLFKSGPRKGQPKEEKDIYKSSSLGPKTAEKIVESNSTLEKFLNSHELYREKFEISLNLVDFERIPGIVRDKIIEDYEDSTIQYNVNGMLDYFMNEGLQLHVDNINKFYISNKENIVETFNEFDF